MRKPKVEIWYELETRCNLHCKFCFNYWKDGIQQSPRRLSTGDSLECLRRLFDAVECEKMSISGGEPLLREDLYDILAFIKGHDIPMVLTTNSTLLNPQNILRLMDSGILTFQVPFHSANQALHDKLSGAECWRDTLKAFISLRENGANVIAVFVATRLNLKEFGGVLEVCGALGIEEIIFNRFVPSGLGLKNRHLIGVPDDTEIIPVLIEANQLARNLNLQIHLGVPVDISPELRGQLDHISTASCPVAFGQTRWTLDAEGNIRRCNHSAAAIGNLLNGGADNLLKEINNSSYNQKKDEEIQPCQFIETNRLVQIQLH